MIGKNNPFNIRYVKSNNWKGLKGQTKGFCNFESMDLGLRAGILLLRNYVYRKGLHTVDEVISRFAPSSENNTSEYISFVTGVLRSHCVEPSDLTYHDEFCYHLSESNDFYWLCFSILKKENGYKLELFDFQSICKKYKIDF